MIKSRRLNLTKKLLRNILIKPPEYFATEEELKIYTFFNLKVNYNIDDSIDIYLMMENCEKHTYQIGTI